MLLTLYVVGFKSHDMYTKLINATGISGLMQDQFNLRCQLTFQIEQQHFLPPSLITFSLDHFARYQGLTDVY